MTSLELHVVLGITGWSSGLWSCFLDQKLSPHEGPTILSSSVDDLRHSCTSNDWLIVNWNLTWGNLKGKLDSTMIRGRTDSMKIKLVLFKLQIMELLISLINWSFVIFRWHYGILQFATEAHEKNKFEDYNLKGHWTSIISSQLFTKKVGIFIPLEVLAWVMTACWVLRSRLTYFWRNMNKYF